MGKGFAKKKKAAKMMQQQLSQFQKDLEEKEVTGSVGDNLVSITLKGDHVMKKISIKPECIDPEDPEELEDLITAAYADALKKLKEDSPQDLSSMPQDMGDLSSLLPFDLNQFQ